MKICRRCDKEYPSTSEYFYKNKQCKDGLHPYCKNCKSKIHKDYMSDPVVKKEWAKYVVEYQRTPNGKRIRKKYDSSKKKRIWRHERTQAAREGAIKFMEILKQK